MNGHNMADIRIYDYLVQGSEEWLEARRGLITASTLGKLITPSTLKPADNETSRTLILTLAAERITGRIDYVHPTFDMQRGTDDEPFARELYADNYAPVTEVGFITRTDGDVTVGYSPDGLVGETGLLEIKSRKPREQIRTFLDDRIPAYNRAQIEMAFYVTGREYLDYVSYSAGMPLYVKRVYPHDAWQAAIPHAIEHAETIIRTTVERFTHATTGAPATEWRTEMEDIRL